MAGEMIYQKIADIMKEFGSIGKTKTNKQQGFMYRGIDDVYLVLQPLLAKHEVFSVGEVMEERSEERQSKAGGALIYCILRIKYTFYATDGSNVSCVVIGEGMDSGDKASNKALAIGHKYAILQTFCVPTEEPKDPDKDSYEVKSNPKKASPPAAKPDKQVTSNFDFLKAAGKLKAIIEAKDGNSESYYDCLGVHGFEHANEIIERKDQEAFYNDMKKYCGK